MKTFFKIIFLLLILAVLAVVLLFTFNKEKITETVRIRIASELSNITNYDVSIGSVEYTPFNTVILNKITISSHEKPLKTVMDINTITVSFDMLSILKEKQLKTTIDIEGLQFEEFLCNITLRTISEKAPDFDKVFDLSLVESVSVIESLVSQKGFILKDIYGIIELDKLVPEKGKLQFSCNKKKYLLNFSLLPVGKFQYNISLASDDLNLSCDLTRKAKDLIINRLEGMFYTLHFDLTGKITHFLYPDILYSLKGAIETDLITAGMLPGKLGDIANRHILSGPVEITMDMETTDPYDPAKYKVFAEISAHNARIDKILIHSITSDIELDEGRLRTKRTTGDIYGGNFFLNMKMDISEKMFPYLFSLNIYNMDFGSFMRDISTNKIILSGVLNSNLNLSGYLSDKKYTEGGGNINITNADLGPMPFLTPLVGNLYGILQSIIPSTSKIQIQNASSDFIIRDERIYTDNLTLLSKDVSISANGYIDFEGNLNFEVKNHFREIAENEDIDWQTSLQSAIIGLGKIISRTHLRGTIKNPEWSFR